MSIEEQVEIKMRNDELLNAIKTLSKIQQRRIMMYYFEDMTLEVIAKKERCTKMAVKFSLDIALKNLSQKLKK